MRSSTSVPEMEELLVLMQASCEAFLQQHKGDWDVIAKEAMVRFGLTEIPILLVAIREAIWEAYPSIIRARRPRAVAKSVARRAAWRQAVELLPEEERGYLKGKRARGRRRHR